MASTNNKLRDLQTRIKMTEEHYNDEEELQYSFAN